MTLVIATSNAHKLEEYSTLLGELPLASLADYPKMEPVDENAPTFIGNAIKKARAARRHTGAWTLADDSGISVSALDGAPGVRSARYAPGSDEDRCRALLAAMAGQAQRDARFICAIALAGVPLLEPLPTGLTVVEGCVVAEGYLCGQLAHGFRGASGFGYDPIFELPGGLTVGEISAAEKHLISHRGNALRLIKPYLEALFG